MGEAYWRYTDPRLQPQIVAAPPPTEATAMAAAMPPLKRRYSDYDAPTGHEQLGIYPREGVRTANRSIADTESINASYDRYLRTGYSSIGAVDPVLSMPGRAVDDPRTLDVGVMDNRAAGYSNGRPEPTLPRDATNTLFVEGLPANCSRREVSHIFRPFIGFREVRLVNKESKRAGGEHFVLCFVDFANASQATVALDALQGYKFDEHEHDSERLRIQFSRSPGPKSASGSRGRR